MVATLRAAVASLAPPLSPTAATAMENVAIDIPDAFILDIGSSPGPEP